AYYTQSLGFVLLEDIDQGGGKRWVRVAPADGAQTALLLAQASGERQHARVGDQTGGRVGFFLHTDDFHRDHAAMLKRGVRFVESPRVETYGTVAV
ncbi:VOC family protein, partial [Lysobacter sp. 2RAB21]